jgi:hypothetical protein
MKRRIMYIEAKPDGVSGPARIGRVKFSKTGRSLYYGDVATKSSREDLRLIISTARLGKRFGFLAVRKKAALAFIPA